MPVLNFAASKSPTAQLIADTGLLFGPLDAKNNYQQFTSTTAPFTASSYLPVQLAPGATPPTLTQILPYSTASSSYTTNIPQTVSAALEINSVLGAFLMPRMTNTEINALVATNGMQVYNLTFDTIDCFLHGEWTPINSGWATIVSTGVNYIAAINDFVISCSAAGVTVTIPTHTLVPGKLYIIADASGGASGSPITVQAATGNINASSSVSLSTNYGSVKVYSSGSGWFTW